MARSNSFQGNQMRKSMNQAGQGSAGSDQIQRKSRALFQISPFNSLLNRGKAEVIRRDEHRQTQRIECPSKEKRSRRAIGFRTGRVGARDKETGHHANTRIRGTGNGSAGQDEIIGTGIDKIAIGIARRPRSPGSC